ncbi:MAG: glycosyltransferase family 39 protein [Anaerolineae bacterium]
MGKGSHTKGCHSRSSNWIPVLLGALTLVGALLRVWHIGAKSLWIDEAFSAWVAQQLVGAGVSWLVRIDQHPPLYYALLHVWLRLGDGPAVLRLLSASASVLNIPVLYALGARLAGRKVGLLAAAILVLSPFHVYLAQEARMYALLSLLVSLSLWALACLVSEGRTTSRWVSGRAVGIARTKRPTPGEHRLAVTDLGPLTRRNGRALRLAMTDLRRWIAAQPGIAWAGYIVATATALWTHNAAVLYWIAANAIVLGLWGIGHVHCDGRPWAGALTAPPLRHWALAQGAVLLLWAPWLPGFFRQSAAVYAHFWLPAPTWRTVLRAIGDFLCAFLPQRIGWTAGIWAGYGALLALGLWSLRRRRGGSWFVLAAFALPVGGAWLTSAIRPIFYDRTLIWTTVPLYLLLAAGLAGLRYRSFVLVATTMLATLGLLSLRDYYTGFQKEAWDQGAAYVAARAEQGDLVLFHATWAQLPFDYYFQRYGVPLEERGVPVDLFARGVLEPQMTPGDVPALHELVAGRKRVWLVYSHQWYTDPGGLVPQVLGEALALQSRRRFYGLEVRLYAPTGCPTCP